jgi:hypothetical protein
MAEFEGIVEDDVSPEDHFRLHLLDGERSYVDLRRRDVKASTAVEGADGVTRWLIRVDDDAPVEPGMLSSAEWSAAFESDEPLKLRKGPPTRPTFDHCKTYGISHGFCCP